MRIVDGQLAVHEALRRMGFDPSEIFVAYNHGKPMTVVKAQDKTFLPDYTTGPNTEIPKDAAAYEDAWVTAVEAWNDKLTDDERQAIYNKYMSRERFISLTVALIHRGFRIPNIDEALVDRVKAALL